MFLSQYLAVGVAFMIIDAGYALQCYTCVNMELAPDSSSLFKLLSGQTDASCGHQPSGGNVQTCETGSNCGSVNADLTASVIGGTVHAKVQVRSCLPDSSIGGCRRLDDSQKSLIEGLLKLTTASDVQLDGSVCTCPTDLCDPNCDSSAVQIGGVCIQWWVIGVSGGGVLLVLVLLCTCCCCCCGCCGCCKSKPRPTVISSVPYQTLTVVQQSSAGSVQYGVDPVGPPPQYTRQAYTGQGYPGEGYTDTDGVAGLSNPLYGQYNQNHNAQASWPDASPKAEVV